MLEGEYLTEQQVAKITAIPLQTLRNLRYLKKIFPYTKIGRSVRYRREDVFDALERGKVITKE